MGIDKVLFLSVLYAIVGTYLGIYLYMKYKKNYGDKNNFYYIYNCMYILIYFVIPATVHFYVYLNGNAEKKYAAINYSRQGILELYLFLVFAIVGFIAFQLGYKYRFIIRQTRTLQKKRKIIKHYDSTWFILGIVLLILGTVSFFLWVKAYGGIQGVIYYKSDLRSGNNIGITNEYTLFKRFVPLVQFANIVFAALFAKNRKIYFFVLFVITLCESILYLIANDGRAPLVFHLVAIIFVWHASKKHNERKAPVKKNLYKIILMGIGGFVTLFFIHNLDSVINIVSGKSNNVSISFDLISSVREEFAFTVRNGQAIFLYLEDNPFSFRIFKEILSGILGILPSSFRPLSIDKLEMLNTSYWVKYAPCTYYGGKPPDIITTGIYVFNYIGVFLLPLIFGRIVKKFDLKLSEFDGISKKIFFAACMYPLIRTVAYTNFDGIMLSFFYIMVSYLILYFIEKIKIRT